LLLLLMFLQLTLSNLLWSLNSPDKVRFAQDYTTPPKTNKN
jgi:hypothetical protein